ncbi:MAG: hypothetical protein IJK98_02980, partial [Clostridia bacterium]|nr:hypothetical protein [Clostridia bacterium]
MRIVCDTHSLTEVCLNVQRCVPTKAVLPHIEGILMKTTEDSAIELSGFDLDLGVTTKMEVSVERPGAVVLNVILNALFIFGLFGIPAMRYRGAALATTIARVVEL